VPAKKPAKPRSTASLKREIAALRSTLDNVWAVLVDIDEANTQEEAVEAIYEACEIMASDWPDNFEITDEVSLNVQAQVALEEQLNELAQKAEATEDWSQRAMIFREAITLQFGLDKQYMEQQIEQLTPQEHLELASRYLWLMGALTAKAPINYREVADRLIKTLKEHKKTLPRKHGPEGSPVITEAMRIREKEKKPYKDIYDQLFPKYGEQMISKNLTPKILGERVRSRRSRLRRLK
jgi:hypothetical protein